MNANNTTAQKLVLMVSVNDDYPLFKAVGSEEVVLMRQTGDWAGYWFKLVKYSLEDKTLFIYHTPPARKQVSLYFRPPTALLKKMTAHQAIMAPPRILAEHLGLEKGVYYTTVNFDSPTTRPRSVGIFSPILNKDEVEGYRKVVIDLKEVSPDELSGYFEGRGYPQGVNLHSFFDVERDHIVSFVRQIRRKVVN